MFLYGKAYETTGTIKYENYGSQIVVSGYKSMSTPAYTTGTARFRITKREHKVISSKDGRTTVDRLLTQFGADELKQLNDTGIYLDVGRLKLTYSGNTYRLIDYDDFGQSVNRVFIPFGITEVVFEKEKTRVDAN